MKTCVIFHSVDLDGWMSAAIVKHWFKQQEVPNKKDEPINTIDFIGYNYGQPIPDLSEYDKVIMCDISFPKATMNALALYGKLIWIDHHISAIKDSATDDGIITPYNTVDGLRDTNFAACELTWKYFFPNETMPEIVRLLGLYDSFRHKGTDEEKKVLEFQYGARQIITNYISAYDYLTHIDKDIWYDIYIKGVTIYQYLCTEAKQTYKNGFVIYFRYSHDVPEHKQLGFTKDVIYKFICINKERFNPINFGIDYHKDGYDGAACFHYADGMWNFSLYNDNGEVDCSVIAKQFGGGGHKGAAGFVLNNEEFLKIIS